MKCYICYGTEKLILVKIGKSEFQLCEDCFNIYKKSIEKIKKESNFEVKK